MAKAGRPPSIDEKATQCLESAFRDGAHIYEACEACSIPVSTYYATLKRDPTFLDRMDLAQEYVTEIARAVVSRQITTRRDSDTAKWWLERRAKDKFSTRSELSGDLKEDITIRIVDDKPNDEGE
jgi:hypothetical protein